MADADAIPRLTVHLSLDDIWIEAFAFEFSDEVFGALAIHHRFDLDTIRLTLVSGCRGRLWRSWRRCLRRVRLALFLAACPVGF